MRHNVYHSKVTQRRQAHRAQSIASEVQESRAEWSDASVGMQTVTDGRHAMLAHAEADVSARRSAVLEIP